MTLNYTNFQGIGIIGIVGVIGGSIYFYLSPPHSSTDWIVWVSYGLGAITYFSVFWILPSHLLLKGLKKEHTMKCLIWLLFMIFNAIVMYLFYMFIKMLQKLGELLKINPENLLDDRQKNFENRFRSS